MGKTRSRWVLQQQPADRIEQMATAAQVSPLVATLLLNRGVQISEAPAFLQPQLRDMPDPWLMADAQPAAERVARAIADGEQICVYGDYDVDGVTAAALLSDYLKRVGRRSGSSCPIASATDMASTTTGSKSSATKGSSCSSASTAAAKR